LPAFGEKSGRRLAWLLYGTDKRLDAVRGTPMLALVLQSLKEIDRYRDATLRKAVLASILAMFITKTQDKMGTRPITGGAIRRAIESTIDSTGTKRNFKVAEQIPGLVLDELQTGEEPRVFPSNGAVEGFGVFEEAVLQAVAWGNGVPPEIYKLGFSNNYSASQAAINEYKMELNKLRTSFGENFCAPLYEEWLLAQTLTGKIQAQGLLESWRDVKQYDRYGAWVSCDWAGQIKPAVDLSKLVGGYKEMVAEGACTRDRMARELTGMKHSKVVQILRRENIALAEANEPMAKLKAAEKPAAQPGGSIDDESTDAEDVAETRKPIKPRAGSGGAVVEFR
jgi:capsid protein